MIRSFLPKARTIITSIFASELLASRLDSRARTGSPLFRRFPVPREYPMPRIHGYITRISRYSWQAYFAPFLIILATVSIPSKWIFYTSAILSVTFLLITGRVLDIRHTLAIISCAVIAILSLSIESLYNQISLLSAILWFFTNSAFIMLGVLFTFLPKENISTLLITKMFRWAVTWALFQSFIGIIQYSISGNSDAVAGTVGLFDFANNITINQVYFGFALLSIIPLFGMYHLAWSWPMRIGAVAVCIIAVGLSQSGHATIMFMIALLSSVILCRLNIRHIMIGLMFAGFAGYAMTTFYPDTVELAQMWISKTVHPSSPKIISINQVRSQAYDDFKLAIIGSGPGQYISRAAMIGSGLLTKWQHDWQKRSGRMEADWIAIFYYAMSVGEGSAIAKPYNMYLSIASEWGIVGLTIVIYVFVMVVIRCVRAAWATRDEGVRQLCMYVVFFWIFWMLCGVVELYHEFPAAFLPAGWLALCAFRFLTQEVRREERLLRELEGRGEVSGTLRR